MPILVLLLLLLSAAPLTAQEDSADTVRYALDSLRVEILRDVTAERLAPYAVSTLDAEALRRARTGAFLEEALGRLPGLQIQNRYNFAVGERLAVRGFGPRAQFGVRGIRILVDGIPATLPDGQSTLDHLDLSTLGRAELLRGPASALYGNAAGGVLLFRTEPPRPGPLRPGARVVVGSDGLVNSTVSVEGRPGSVGLRAAVSRLDWDGFRTDPVNDGLYGGADRWQLNAQATAPLADGLLRITLNGLDLEAENPGSLARDALEESKEAFRFNVLQGTRKAVEQLQLGAHWEGPLGSGGLRAEAATWGIVRDLLNPIPPSVVQVDRRAGGARALLHGGAEDAGAGPTWTAGAELEVMRDDRKNFENDGGRAGGLTLDQRETVRGTGLFARGAVPLGDVLRLSGALRYDRFRFEADDRFAGPAFGGDPDDSGERVMEGWSPTVGLTAAVDPAVTLWANVTTSLETPTTTELVNRPDGAGGFNPALEPRRTTGFEVGARGRVGAILSWEVAAFRADIEDELVPFEVPDAPGRSFFRNAGSSRHDGVETTLRADLGAGFRSRLVWSWTDARFEEYAVDGEDFSDHRVPGLAPHRVTGVLGQDGGWWSWDAEVEWVDEVPVDDANTEFADAYALMDVRAAVTGLTLASWHVEPFAGVTNLFDESYVSSVAVNAFGGRYYEPGPGRSVYTGVTFRPR